MASAGGAAISGSELSIVGNGGTITGGLGGNGRTRADAITFTGGDSTLTLNGVSIIGNIAVTGSVTFNQSTAQTLNNVITGSGAVIQAGTGTLTLWAAPTPTAAAPR